MDGALSHLRSLDTLEWVNFLAVAASAVCLLSLAALMIVGNGRLRWRWFRRYRLKTRRQDRRE
ncbi:hypothetical protein [Reyranella sp.]|uniref:hypothetical protein n=1 Tax=Reyranella sp. TaxID=1929291 RepID=UPI003D0A5CFA